MTRYNQREQRIHNTVKTTLLLSVTRIVGGCLFGELASNILTLGFAYYLHESGSQNRRVANAQHTVANAVRSSSSREVHAVRNAFFNIIKGGGKLFDALDKEHVVDGKIDEISASLRS